MLKLGTDQFYGFVESCLRHKNEMVIFEAARAMLKLRAVTTRELTPAITVLQLFLSSSKAVLRFAAIRTVNKMQLLKLGGMFPSCNDPSIRCYQLQYRRGKSYF